MNKSLFKKRERENFSNIFEREGEMLNILKGITNIQQNTLRRIQMYLK